MELGVLETSLIASVKLCSEATEPLLGVAEQVVEALGLRREGVESRQRAAGAAGLLREELVVDAPHLRRV